MRLKNSSVAERGARVALPVFVGALLVIVHAALGGCGGGDQIAPAVAQFASGAAALEVPNVAADPESSAFIRVLELIGDEEFRGTFAEGESVRRAVTLRNLGAEAVTLSVPAKSCGCVKSDLATTLLPPGQATLLSLETPASVAQFGSDEVAHWVEVVALNASSPEPIDHIRVPIRFRSSRDWHALPGSLDAIVRVGESIEVEAFVGSISGTEIEEFRVGSCSIRGMTAHAERAGPSLWRVILCGRIAEMGTHEGYLEVEPMYRKGERFNFPVRLRVKSAACSEPAGIVLNGASAREFCLSKLPTRCAPDALSASIVPPNNAITLAPIPGRGTAFKVRAAALDADYGGAIEVRDGEGVLVAQIPLAVFR